MGWRLGACPRLSCDPSCRRQTSMCKPQKSFSTPMEIVSPASPQSSQGHSGDRRIRRAKPQNEGKYRLELEVASGAGSNSIWNGPAGKSTPPLHPQRSG